jgi:hypothetical protein
MIFCGGEWKKMGVKMGKLNKYRKFKIARMSKPLFGRIMDFSSRSYLSDKAHT